MSEYVLVTGAIGLIGHAVRTRLEDRGDKVIAIDRIATSIDGRDVLECDVTDAHGLHAIARRFPLRAIVHCGAFSGPMVSPDHPMQMIRVNVGGTANVGELARVIGGIRLVFASTATAYGATPKGPVPENTVMEPDSMYGASKAASEQILNAYKRQFGVDTVSIRLTWVYGPRRTTACLIRKMLTDAMAGRPTQIPYGRDFPRQYIHINDAADAMVAALDRPNLPQQAYNISGGSWLTLSEVAEAVMGVIPGARVEVLPGDDPGDMHQERFDISAAERDLGYRPKMSLERGVTSYFDWLKANGVTA
ncbi:NAD-dependent epimerase/dehydratase family protein [Allorhizobium sp. NPDC080224]|jgi:nucleoside-diphosphate-sugar epimerase|uniref:NAD-dependent epimerase/dehydratase family protein n=1 Tax=Allorhizobium sp. NPDC080224 TaxID=3390547 RepID=UPI0018263179|nr:NAD(P)-dependent oxidoreductase [Hyphomicrobiales bacterium]